MKKKKYEEGKRDKENGFLNYNKCNNCNKGKMKLDYFNKVNHNHLHQKGIIIHIKLQNLKQLKTSLVHQVVRKI